MLSRIVKDDFGGLNNIVKALSDGRVVKVGIMGQKGHRARGKITNAELGAIHEFGSFLKHIVARSWLRMPIHHEAGQIAKSAAKASTQMAKDGNITGILKNIGIACEAAIQNAFDTRGFGSWKPDNPSTIRQKKSDGTLIDTGQLRRSVTSKVGNPS